MGNLEPCQWGAKHGIDKKLEQKSHSDQWGQKLSLKGSKQTYSFLRNLKRNQKKGPKNILNILSHSYVNLILEAG